MGGVGRRIDINQGDRVAVVVINHLNQNIFKGDIDIAEPAAICPTLVGPPGVEVTSPDFIDVITAGAG